MPRKALFPVLYTIVATITIISVVKLSSPDIPAPAPEIISPPSKPAPHIPSSYEIKLTDGNICLYTLDEKGSELERKTLGYIDIHSLQAFQLDKLLAGAKFESREAVAEFIQDLDS